MLAVKASVPKPYRFAPSGLAGVGSLCLVWRFNPRLRTGVAEILDSPVDQKFHVHLVSDSTGETLHAMATAALAQFENVDVMVHPYALVRAEAQLTRALDHIAIMPGIVFFTLANVGLRDGWWRAARTSRCAASMCWKAR